MKYVLALCLALSAIAADRPLLPARFYDVVRVSSIGAPVPAGDGYVALAGAPDDFTYVQRNFIVFLDADLRLRRAVPPPIARGNMFVIHDVVVVMNEHEFIRLTPDGELLDLDPRPLPVPALYFAANEDHVLILGSHPAEPSWFVEPDGSVDPVVLPRQGMAVASDGHDFLIPYAEHILEPRLGVFDTNGNLVRSIGAKDLPGYYSIASDGRTWSLRYSDDGTRILLYDRELQRVGTRWETSGYMRAFHGFPRGGYTGADTSLTPLVEKSATYAWLRPPDYALQHISFTPPRWFTTSFLPAGDFVAENEREDSWVRAGLFADLATALQDPDSLRQIPGAFPVDRESPLVVTNNAGQSLVVWFERGQEPGAKSTVHAARLSPEGRTLDRDPLTLGEASDDIVTLAATSDGDDYLVAWYDGPKRTEFRAVTAAGELLPLRTLRGITIPAQMALAGREGAYAFVYLALDGDWNLSGMLLHADGTPAASPHVLVDAALVPRFPALAAAPYGFLLVYGRGLARTTQTLRLDATLSVASGGYRVAANEFTPYSLTPAGERFVLVTSDGQVLWLNANGSRDGAANDPSLILGTAGRRILPSCDGEDCTLLWSDVEHRGAIFAGKLGGHATPAVEEAVTLHESMGGPSSQPLLLRANTFVYAAYDGDTGGYQIFVRPARPPKQRSVR